MKLHVKNRFLITAICALFVFVTPAVSLEWGGIFKNDTQALLPNFNNFSFSQSNSLYMWITSPLGQSGMYFSGEGMYKYTLTVTDGNNDFVNVADIDLFKIYGDYELNKGTFSFSAGRYMFADSTSAIFIQNFDGASIKYSGRKFAFSAFGGYTGLLNSLAVSMINKDGVVFESKNKFYNLANGFVPAGATFEFPSLFANQALSLQALAVLDMGEEKYNRYYGTLLLSGPLSNKVFYYLASAFGTTDFASIMNYSTFSLYMYPTDIMSVSLGTEYASGKNGFLSPFLGVTSRSVVNSLSAPQTTGAIIPNVSCSFVVDKVYVGITSKVLLAIPESEVQVKGVEADLSFIYAPFTDLQLGLDINSYIDISKSNDNNLTATLRAALSF